MKRHQQRSSRRIIPLALWPQGMAKKRGLQIQSVSVNFASKNMIALISSHINWPRDGAIVDDFCKVQ